MNIRKLAFNMLCRAEEENTYVNLMLSGAHAISADEKRFLTALLYGVTERRITLDYYIAILAKRPKEEIDAYTKNILRLGLYQLLYMDKIPPFAAVDECVKMARNKGEAAFVNAVLRSVERERDSLNPPPREKNTARHLSVKYSFPTAIVRLFISQYGEDEAEKILSAFCRLPALCLRVNTKLVSRERLLSELVARGFSAKEDKYSPDGILVDGNASPRSLPGYEQGLFFVQDTASQIAMQALSPTRGSLIIDVCACPGGKSFSAALLAFDDCELISLDISESKLGLIESGAKRLRLESIRARLHDSTSPIDEYVGRADFVICDAPCSGLGVLAKKPDLRYRDTDFSALAPTQYEILCASSKYLRVGGTLVYSTCTLNREENEDNVKRFLSEHPNFFCEDFCVSTLESENGMLTLYPHIHETDGFFVAKIKRNA